MKKLIGLLLSVLIITSAFAALPSTVYAAESSAQAIGASSGTTGDCVWRIEGTTLIISGNGKMGNYDRWGYNYPQAPFEWNDNIKSLVIENGVKNIGEYAFYRCEDLTEVSIPESVTVIDKNAFNGCTGLVDVTIPNGVETISDYAFSNCSNLKSISFGSGLKNITDYAFIECKSLESLYIPANLTNIFYTAFDSCSGLKNITVDPNNKTFDSRNNCNALIISYSSILKQGCENTIIPEGITQIGTSAFYGCNGLKEIYIPSTVKRIDSSAFKNCTGLTQITIPESVTNMGTFAFEGCTNLKSVTLPQNTQYISYGEFYKCSSLTNINLPETITSIARLGFYGCSSLTEIVIPENVRSIDETAFSFCASLCSVTLPDKLTTIEKNAFYSCTSLKSITITKSVTTIDETALGYAYDYASNKDYKIDGFIIYGYSGTAAQKYAADNGFTFISADGKRSIAGCSVTVSPDSFTYDGKAKTPSVTVKDGNKALVKDSDYSVTYSNNTNVGTASVTITGIGNYTGSVTKDFTITRAAGNDISNCVISLSQTSFTYDGKAKTPTVTVKDGSLTLSNGTDYSVAYSNNINVGTAAVTVTGKGNYTGSVNITFSISEAPKTDISSCTITLSQTSYVYDGKEKKPAVTVKYGSKTLTNGSDYTVIYPNAVKAGTYSVTITGSGNYTGSESRSFTIEEAPVAPSNSFVWGQDNWSFDNTSKYFSGYSVNSTVFNQLKQDLNMSYSQAYELKQEIEEDSKGSFNGSCFGMTISEIMVKQGDLKLSRYGGNDNVNKNTNTSNMTSLINFIQELQSVSGYSQVIRQAPFMSGGYSQYDFIDKAESVLSNEDCFVKISYAINLLNKNTGKYYSNGAHAVLGYGIENCNYYSSVTGKTYDKRILIADPNYLSQNTLYDESCIYYKSSDHSWICPYWNYSFGSYTELCYWNSSSGSSTNTGYIRNIMKYNSLSDTVDLMADYSVSHYISGLTVNNFSGNATAIEQINNTGNPNLDYAGPGGSGIAQYNIEMDDSYYTEDNEEFYSLWNPTSNYSLSYNIPSDFKFKMDYEKTAYYGNVENGLYALFKPNGSLEFRGSDADYSLTIVTDEELCVNDWYGVTVSGKEANNLTYKTSKQGYILSSDNLNNVTVSAMSDESEVKRTFSTEYNSVLIYEINKKKIGIKVDTDNNGTYETELAAPDEIVEIGDSNEDGIVDILDAALIQKYTVEKATLSDKQREIADVNNDGVVDILDVTDIQKFAVEKITEFKKKST